MEVSDETPAVHLNVCESVYSTMENAAICHSSVRERGREYVDVLEKGTGWSMGHRVYPINHTNNTHLPRRQKNQKEFIINFAMPFEKKARIRQRGEMGKKRVRERRMRINNDRLPAFFNENGLIG